MVSSVNNLDCWRFKGKRIDFIAWIACVLVFFGADYVGRLGVLFRFSMENYNDGVTSSDFLLCRFLPPVLV
jgi:hypothetical protein